MSQLYIWQYRNLPAQEACIRFIKLLEEETSFYNSVLPTNSTYRYTWLENLLIGQIYSDLGILDWKPWSQCNNVGVAWAGVCENFLGSKQEVLVIQQLIEDILFHPKNLTDLLGNFSLCTWSISDKRAAVVTGSTKCSTLWQTSGPLGWAVGSRARPLLNFVGKQPELNVEAASTFIAFGFLLDDDALFKDVKRIPSRTRIIINQQAEPDQCIYCTLQDYLGEPIDSSFEELVDICAKHLSSRVSHQLFHSQKPKLHLTGGRDSRCLAAALSHVGFTGPASTGGTFRSKDVVIASKIAKRLGFSHSVSGFEVTEIPFLFSLLREQLQTWSKISEGIETIRHGLHHIKALKVNGQSTHNNFLTEQNFNGLHPGMAKPSSAYQVNLLKKKIIVLQLRILLAWFMLSFSQFQIFPPLMFPVLWYVHRYG